MKITRLKLTNWRGIYDGTRLHELELNFTTDKRFIIFLGGNGSGKSTIMSALTPYATTFDNRKNLIIDGKVGGKEIDYLMNDGTKYFIKHHYETRKNKSFIKRVTPEGEETELNPNGGVQTFIKIIEDIFGINEDIFKINAVGSQSESIIDLNSTKRKEYISNFTPSIEPYLAAYEVVNAKLNALNKEVKFLSDELNKLETKENLERSKKIAERTLELMDKDIKRLMEEAALHKVKSEGVEGILEEIKTLEERFYKVKLDTTVLNDIRASSKLINRLLDEGSPDDFDELTYAEAIKASKNILTAYSEGTGKERLEASEKAMREKETILLQEQTKYDMVRQGFLSTENELSRLEKDGVTLKRMETIKANLEKLASDHETISASLASFPYWDEEEGKLTVDKNTLIEASDTLKDYMMALETWIIRHPGVILHMLNEGHSLDEILKKYEESVLLKEAKVEHAERTQSMESALRVAKPFLEKFHPCTKANCDCEYHKAFDALSDDIEEDDELESASQELKGARRNLENVESGVSAMKDLLPIFKHAEEALKVFTKGFNFKVPTTLNEFAEDGTLVFNDLRNTLDGYITMLTSIRECENIELTYDQLEVELKRLENATSEITRLESTYKKQKSECEAMKELIDSKYKVEYAEANALYEKHKRALTNISNALTSLNKVLASVIEHDELSTSIRALRGDNENKLQSATLLKKVNEELESLRKERDETSNNLDGVKLQMLRRKEFEDRLTATEEQKVLLTLVKDATAVKSGIPLYMVGNYLESVKHYTNKLLDIAFNGRFAIDFVITDKDLLIPVYKDFSVSSDDITLCSQGEVSLVKTTLSLGLISRAIETTSNRYNIVSLDEIDAELDVRNRTHFLDILNTQLDHLKCEQAFIITHNDSFTASEAGLVLLRNANIDIHDENVMFNKDVLFSLN